MPDTKIADDVKKVITELLSVEESAVTESAKFVDDLGADSLDTVELVMALEEKFDIEISDLESQKENIPQKIQESGKKVEAALISEMWSLDTPQDVDYFLNNFQGDLSHFDRKRK